jgi:hypothetical protein
MNKSSRLLLLALAFLMLTGAPEALAKNMQGKMGLGFQQTMPGAHGFSIAYWTNSHMAVQLLLGGEFLMNDNSNTNQVHYGLGTKYVLVATRFANLSIGARLSGAFASEQTFTDNSVGGKTTTDSNVFQLALEVPFEIEYFFSDAFAINLAFGVMATKVSSKGPLLKPQGLGATETPGSTGIGIGSGGLLGAAGFTFYL